MQQQKPKMVNVAQFIHSYFVRHYYFTAYSSTMPGSQPASQHFLFDIRLCSCLVCFFFLLPILLLFFRCCSLLIELRHYVHWICGKAYSTLNLNDLKHLGILTTFYRQSKQFHIMRNIEWEGEKETGNLLLGEL